MRIHLWLPFFAALFLASCAGNRDGLYSSCCTDLPLAKIAGNLGFQMDDLGMHDYRFFNQRCEFHLLASADEVSLCDESSFRGGKFSPIWTLRGKVTEEEVEAKIRLYLSGRKARPSK